MRLISYDCEVFAYDWLVTLKDKETGVYTCIWNDNEALKMALSDDCIYVGFNSKHYDQYIIKAIAAGFAPEEIKKVNDFIIAGGQGWQCPLLDGIYFRFSNVDIRDDTQQGLSLKAIEGHLGMSVKESSVPFDIDRPLTPEEKTETEFYCKSALSASFCVTSAMNFSQRLHFTSRETVWLKEVCIVRKSSQLCSRNE